MSIRKARFASREMSLALLFLGYVSVAAYMSFGLNYEFLRSDVLAYWQDSLNWTTPFNRFHVPGYPLLIAFARSSSFGELPALALMMGINLIALLVCSASIYQIAKISGVSDRYAALASCLFGLWPFVGLTYAVDPLADIPAMAFLLAGLLALFYARNWVAAFLLGSSLVVHKAMWPFVLLLVLADVVRNKPRDLKYLFALLLLIAPIFLLWATGASHTGSPDWMISDSLRIGSGARAAIPVLEGVVGTLQQGGVKGWLKGGLAIACIALSVSLLFVSYKFRLPYFEYGMAICAATLFLFLFLTSVEIWAAVRFSRLLVLPLIGSLAYFYRERSLSALHQFAAGLCLVALLFTQFAFSWYLAKVYFR